MRQSGCDFTNTFRVLSQTNTIPDSDLLENIMKQAAPKEKMLKNVQNKYGDDPRLKRVLEEQPESLKLFGLDVDEVRNEFERAEKAIAEISNRFEERTQKSHE